MVGSKVGFVARPSKAECFLDSMMITKYVLTPYNIFSPSPQCVNYNLPPIVFWELLYHWGKKGNNGDYIFINHKINIQIYIIALPTRQLMKLPN